MILNSTSLLECNIPYEECQCSVISNKFNNNIECVTDIQTMIAHISPLASYILQIYIINNLFSFKEKLNNIIRYVFWIVTLFIFIIISISAYESTCLYYNTSEFLLYSGTFLYAIFVCLFISSDINYRICLHNKTYQKQGLVKNNHNHEVFTITIVS
jgi:hypothetical protein